MGGERERRRSKSSPHFSPPPLPPNQITMCVLAPPSRPEPLARDQAMRVRRARPSASPARIDDGPPSLPPSPRPLPHSSPPLSHPLSLLSPHLSRRRANVRDISIFLSDDATIILRFDPAYGGRFRIPAAARFFLEPGAGGVTTWHRAGVLRRAAEQGFDAAEMGPDGEWVDLDPEAEAAAAEAAAVTAALAGAAALDLAISRADGTNVAVLSRPPSMPGRFYVPGAVRPVLEPAATGQTYWSRARILLHAAARGLVVEEKRPDGEWVRLDLGAGGM
jgi:hypothetical protein